MDGPQVQPASASESEVRPGMIPSHGISIELPEEADDTRPPPIHHRSDPAYQSPSRHHHRAPSRSKIVKETLNARSQYGSSDDDGSAVHRINQYIIKQEIGRGSFGAVHLAVDQFGDEFAVKEFSKARLRKRAQSNLLRKPNQKRKSGHLAAGLGFNSPMHRLSSGDGNSEDANNALSLIKEEIAIMKKLNHNNLVSLIEVLDDPTEDSLYMVLEICKKGVVMKVGLEETADPYEEETCRCWFRDMMLGIEYLHAQGILHRDIKPDNCLINNEDVLKVVDFGVSEMFEKQSDMATAKSAGSPAFMPPELCVAKHGQVSGRAVDIWSMGVTLYCLRYGKIPFEKTGMIELYEAIRSDDVPLQQDSDKNFTDLMRRLLEKDPEKRITMEQLRKHSWVTKEGTDPLLSAKENCADIVDPPTEAEMNAAITGNMGQLIVVMKAVKRFKKLLTRKRPELMEGIFGRSSRIVAPPHNLNPSPDRPRDSQCADADDRRPIERALTNEGLHREISVADEMKRLPEGSSAVAMAPDPGPATPPHLSMQDNANLQRRDKETDAHFAQRMEATKCRSDDLHSRTASPRSQDDHGKGHAHDPLRDTLFLNVGAGESEIPADKAQDELRPIVSESPGAVDGNVYEQAYQEQMHRITESKGHGASIYLNRRVEHREDLRSHSNVLDQSHNGKGSGSLGGFANLVKMAREEGKSGQGQDNENDDTKEGPEHTEYMHDSKVEQLAKAHGGSPGPRPNSANLPGSMPGAFPLTPTVDNMPQ